MIRSKKTNLPRALEVPSTLCAELPLASFCRRAQYPAVKVRGLLAALVLLFGLIFVLVVAPYKAEAVTCSGSGERAVCSTSGRPGGEAGSPGVGVGKPGSEVGRPISQQLGGLYTLFLAFVGISALFAIVRGGIIYMFSGANIGSVEEAKKWIWNGIYGIVIAAVSYLLLSTINPDLVNHGFNLEGIFTAPSGK